MKEILKELSLDAKTTEVDAVAAIKALKEKAGEAPSQRLPLKRSHN